MPQLNVATYLSQFFWLVLCFISFYLMISVKIAPMFEKLFEKRSTCSASDIREAELMNEEADTIKHEYEKAMSDARQKASSILHDANQKISSEKEKAMHDLAHHLEHLSDQTELKLLKDKSELTANLAPVMKDFIRQCLEKVAKEHHISDDELTAEYQHHLQNKQ